MTKQQNKLVEPILATIVNNDIRDFAKVILDDFPDYMWHVAASSSGKYHPAYSLGESGLMRHQIAVVRFINFFLELEQYNTKFTDRQMDLMRVAALTHDGRKSGEQINFEKSKYTNFDHPVQMATVIRKYDGKYLNHDEIEFIAGCIETHMGQWNTDKKSSVVLSKPITEAQQLVHLADYLSSRKCLTMDFEGYEENAVELPDVSTFVIPIGKFQGQLLIDVFNEQREYFNWMADTVKREPLVTLIKQLQKQYSEDI